MNESLFKAVPQLQGAIMNGETTFEFLQRGGRTEAIEIRQWMETWFQEYPEDHGVELKKRLQSKHFAEFLGAYFELQVYSILRLLGCNIVIHPGFAETHGTVDFEVTHGKDIFYVEATVCGVSRGILCSSRNEEDATQKIREAIKHPHSDVWLEAEGELLETLGKDRLASSVQKLLDSCLPSDVWRLGDWNSWWRRQHTSIQEADWKLNIFLARPIASDGKGRVRGPSRGGPISASNAIAKVLLKKAKAWSDKKRGDATFVIAVNVCHSEYSSGDELKAIYDKSNQVADQDYFFRYLAKAAGVIVFSNATLGNESAPVRLYENLDRSAPDCLRFLQRETSLRQLIDLN